MKALLSAMALVVGVSIVPSLFDSASGYGSLGVGLAALIALTWFVNYKNGKTL